MKDYSVFLSIPEYQEALKMARQLRQHCLKNKFPNDLEVYGIALDADAIKKEAHEKGYIAGQNFERGRIAKLLGLVK